MGRRLAAAERRALLMGVFAERSPVLGVALPRA